MQEAVLRVVGLKKAYGSHTALQDVSFSLYPGDILGVIGENGAGKSTLLSLLGMIQKPTAGTVYFKEKAVTGNKKEYLSRVGYVPQEIALFEELSGKENLRFFGNAYGIAKAVLEERIERVCRITEFPEEWLTQPVAKYSGGMKRKINIGAALLHEPELLLLDEPVANLDFETEEQVLGTLKHLSENGTAIVYVGHQMEQMETLCDKICLLQRGHQLVFGELQELLRKNGEEKTLKQLWKEYREETTKKE